MKQLCFYRDNSYFNNDDYFLIYDPALDKLFLNTAECGDKGGPFYSAYRKTMNTEYKLWYNKGPLEYKLTSVPCVNYNELISKIVRYKGTELTGKLAQHVILNNFGVHWDKNSPQNFRKWGRPYFWNDPNHIEIIE
jgi:hypothetical protein